MQYREELIELSIRQVHYLVFSQNFETLVSKKQCINWWFFMWIVVDIWISSRTFNWNPDMENFTKEQLYTQMFLGMLSTAPNMDRPI